MNFAKIHNSGAIAQDGLRVVRDLAQLLKSKHKQWLSMYIFKLNKSVKLNSLKNV